MTTTPNLNITEVAINQTQPEVTVNTALAALDTAGNSTLSFTFTANARTLTQAEFTRNLRFVASNQTADATLTVPLTSRSFKVHNKNSSHNIIVGGATGATVTIPALTNVSLVCDGTDVFADSPISTSAVDAVLGNTGSVTLAELVAGGVMPSASGTLTGTVNATGAVLHVAAPVGTSDAATKAYVDTTIQGLSIKPTAVVATITTLPAYTYANGTSGVGATITGTSTGTLTIDGHLTALGDVILVKNETSTNAPNNGLYRVTTAGAVGVAYVLTREIDMDSSTEFTGALIAVGEVSVTYPGTLWICNQTAPTLGTTNIAFTQISAVAASQWNAGTVTSVSSNFTIVGSVLSLAPTLDLTGLTEVKVPATTNAADAARKDYVDNATGAGLVLQGYLSGLNITTASTTTFTVATGQCMSDDNTTMMTLASAITKSTAGTWVAGSGNNGLDTGTIAITTWYHVFVIYNPTSKVTDVVFSTSATAPTLPSGYTKQRRIGSQRTGNPANLFTMIQTGDRVDFATPVNLLNNASFGNTTANSQTVFAPLGVVTEAIMDIVILDTTNANSGLYVSSLAQSDVAASGSTGLTAITAGAAGTFGMAGGIRVETDLTSKVRMRANASTLALFLNCTGYIDKRGANSQGSGTNWNGPRVDAIGNGFNANSGTLTADGTITYSATAGATLTIVPLSGISDVIVNGPSTGGTVTLALTPAFTMQKWTTHIKQGATAATWNLNSGFVFAATGGPTGFTATPTANARDMLWMQCLDGTHAVVGAILQGITI